MHKERSGLFWFLGGRAQILVPGTATGGALSVMEFTDPKGHAPPLHVHDAEDEIWIVLDGEITFFVGDDRHDLHAGAIAHGPRGVPHSYLVRSSDARMVVAFGPAGIEDWFAANSSPISDVNDVPAAFDIEAIVASATAHHLRVVGPPPAHL
ncbi:cupin domain-containing protein [Nonomuraea sp. NPDC003707]